MAETLFRQWFVEEADDGWEEGKLGDYISVKHGFAFNGTFITDQACENILMTPGNFKIGGGFKGDKFKYFSGDDYPSEYKLNPSDLVVTMTDLSQKTDTLGYPAYIPKIGGRIFLHNQRVGKVIYNSSKSEKMKSYLYNLMKQEDYRSYIVATASGTSIMHTSPDRICNYEFQAPPVDKIIEFHNYTSPIYNKKDVNSINIQTLEKLRDTLLPKLMSGEVRVEIGPHAEAQGSRREKG